MLKFCRCLFITVLFSVTVFLLPVNSRPQLERPISVSSTVTEATNNATANFIEKSTSISRETRKNTNRTRTRILFQGELLGDFGDQDIIFPDTYQSIFDSIPNINNAPKCAKGKTFCENFDPYPYYQVKNILQKNHVQNMLFGKDEALDERISIANRNGDFEAFVCASIQKTIFPRVGKNKNNKWKFIINQEESDGYVQGIRIELCRKEGSPCDLLGERVNGYITGCKQKYMLRRLMSVNESGQPVPDTFQLPSACCCSYKKDLSFLSRFGVEDISGRTKTRLS